MTSFNVTATRPGCVLAELRAVAHFSVLWALLIAACSAGARCQSETGGIRRLDGDGTVHRLVLSGRDLLSRQSPNSPIDDTRGFALPANAAEPREQFRGRLALIAPESHAVMKILRDDYGYSSQPQSPSSHLAPFEFEFVQSGSYLIPVQQGLAITGSPAWNYIIGYGRVWREQDDLGYTRASFPFALVERNQNCTHNGVMTFIFSNHKKPNISNVRSQTTQETCLYYK